MMALFLMPFNMVMLGLWTGVGGWLRERIFKPLAGGVRIITEGPRTSIRLPEYGALIWCLVAVGGLSFVSIFILGFESGFHPSLLAASLVLFLVAAAGAGAYGWQWRKIHSGDDDLILDEEVQTMELPETCGRKNRVTFAFSEIENLTLEVIEHHSRKVTTVRCWSRGWCPRYSVWIRLAACLSGEGSGVATHPQTSLVSSGQGSPRRSALMRLRTAAAATLECQARTSITELREPWSLGTFF
jgi:hypothetical protein